MRCASVEFDARHEIILPKDHQVVTLIVRYYHMRSGHWARIRPGASDREILDSQGESDRAQSIERLFRLRQKTLGEQKKADLPADHVTPDKPPISFVGVYCFGPFLVKRDRSLVKRYGLMFTCFVIRAVHLEVVQSMDTDSFINALRRFT